MTLGIIISINELKWNKHLSWKDKKIQDIEGKSVAVIQLLAIGRLQNDAHTMTAQQSSRMHLQLNIGKSSNLSCEILSLFNGGKSICWSIGTHIYDYSITKCMRNRSQYHMHYQNVYTCHVTRSRNTCNAVAFGIAEPTNRPNQLTQVINVHPVRYFENLIAITITQRD